MSKAYSILLAATAVIEIIMGIARLDVNSFAVAMFAAQAAFWAWRHNVVGKHLSESQKAHLQTIEQWNDFLEREIEKEHGRS